MSDHSTPLDDVIHRLIAADDSGERAIVLDEVAVQLQSDVFTEHRDRAAVALLLFDERHGQPTDASRRENAALLLLEAMADDQERWAELVAGDRFDWLIQDIEISRRPEAMLELMLFAPGTSPLFHYGIERLRTLGVESAADWQRSREIERVLHAFQLQQQAKDVERARKAMVLPAVHPSGSDRGEERLLVDLVVLIAGGHPALRRAFALDLTRSGVRQVREIPSKQEASRTGRDVAAVLRSSHVAILCIRQISHSTSDQVRQAGARLAVPVILSHAVSPSGLRRDVLEWAASTASDRTRQ